MNLKNLQTLDDIKTLLKTYKIDQIIIDSFSIESKMYLQQNREENILYITKNLCKNNPNLLEEVLIYIIAQYKEKELCIKGGSLITDEVVKAISNNETIEEVDFIDYMDPYILTEKHYEFLKGSIKKIYSNNVEDSLKYNFDEIIDYNRHKSLISYYHFADLQDKMLYILNRVTDEELEYLKYVGCEAEFKVTYGSNVIDIIDKLRSSGHKNKVIYQINYNKKDITEELLRRNIDIENVFVEIESKTYPLKDYIEYEKLLYSFVSDAQNLSPFEKYIYAYDIVKKFKKYKEHKKDKLKARELYAILNNNYMVCVGYSNLLGDLLDKLGIGNQEVGIEVGLQPYKAITQLKKKYSDTWDDMTKKEQNELIEEQKNYIPDSWGGHSRRIVHICDEKYGINGLYFSDPTWDNDLENDSYNYLLMTLDEVLNSNRKFKLYFIPIELLYSGSVKEFNEKLNKILDKTNLTKYFTHVMQLKHVVRTLLSFIKNLDKNFYNKLYEKYDFIKEDNLVIDDIYNLPIEVKEYLFDVATYISSNINNFVSGKTILEAVKQVYSNIYMGGMSQEQIDKIQEYNAELADIKFTTNKFR